MPQYAAGQLAGPCEPESSYDPDPPWFAPRACRRAARAAFGEHDPPSTPLGVVTFGYRDQLVEVEAMAAVTGGPTAAR